MNRRLLWIVLAAQILFLVAGSLRQEWILSQGKPILLETAPVDPRDLLRGDYLTLGYPINTIPSQSFRPPIPEAPPTGTVVWVTLNTDGPFATVASASLQRPHVESPDLTVVSGRVVSAFIPASEIGSIRVNYGIERFFVREGTGNPNGKLTVQARADSSGNLRIQDLFLNGVPYRKAMAGQNP